MPLLSKNIFRRQHQTVKWSTFEFFFQASDSNDNTNPDYVVSSAVDGIRKLFPLGCINHTSFPALERNPIAISIAMGRSGGGRSKGTLEIGTWQAAQWRMLEKHLVGLKSVDDIFLPAILISGHEWFFLATTRKGPTTVSLPPTSKPIQSTDNNRNSGLGQRLARHVLSSALTSLSITYS